MKSTFRLMNIGGIEFGVHYSWFLVFFAFSFLLAESQYPSMYEDWSVAEYWIAAVASVLLLFLSVVLHELGHSLVARRRGIAVPSITLFFFGGVAQLEQESDTAEDEFLIAMAGPAVSILLSLVFLLFWIGAREVNIQLAAITGYLALVNLILAAFNMLPGFPLDGGRVLRSIIWFRTGDMNRATAIAAAVGTGFGWLFFGIGLLLIVAGYLINGIWIIAVGWFLQHAAQQAGQMVRQDQAFSGVVVRILMNPHPVSVSSEVDLQQLVDHYILGQNTRGVVVLENNSLVGIVTVTDVKNVERNNWNTIEVRQVMTPLAALRTVAPDDEITKALDLMAEGDLHQLPVLDDNQLVGLLTRIEIVAYLQRQQELGYSI